MDSSIEEELCAELFPDDGTINAFIRNVCWDAERRNLLCVGIDVNSVFSLPLRCDYSMVFE